MFGLSGVVCAIACLPAALAWFLRPALPLPVSIVLWHAAACGVAVAAAASEHAAAHTTWLLGKAADGRMRPLGLLAFWPYHAGLRAKLALQRQLSSEPAYNQVTPQFFIGAWPSDDSLYPKARPAVLDVTCELPLRVAPPAYKAIPVWDTHGPTVDQIDEGVAWAMRHTRAGLPVLIHCAHGHGRSATVLAAVLIAGGATEGVAGAEAAMKAVRPRVRLNRRQRAALLAWLDARGGAKQQ